MESKSSPAHCSCGELRSSLLALGTGNNGGRHTIFWSNEHVRIATEVHQAAQPLLLSNGNAGIQRARKARITAIRPPNALCATASWISTVSLNGQRGFCNRIKDFGFREGLRQHPKQPLTFPTLQRTRRKAFTRPPWAYRVRRFPFASDGTKAQT